MAVARPIPVFEPVIRVIGLFGEGGGDGIVFFGAVLVGRGVWCVVMETEEWGEMGVGSLMGGYIWGRCGCYIDGEGRPFWPTYR